jgi:multimeric flavodoxin WrbA
MQDLIAALRTTRLLVVCTPVYTNTVPGGLKLFIDRCQALHAERTFEDARFHRARGLLLAVSGRAGEENFTCVTKVVDAFFRHMEFWPSGTVLIDNMDAFRDVREVPWSGQKVRDAVEHSIALLQSEVLQQNEGYSPED